MNSSTRPVALRKTNRRLPEGCAFLSSRSRVNGRYTCWWHKAATFSHTERMGTVGWNDRFRPETHLLDKDGVYDRETGRSYDVQDPAWGRSETRLRDRETGERYEVREPGWARSREEIYGKDGKLVEDRDGSLRRSLKSSGGGGGAGTGTGAGAGGDLTGGLMLWAVVAGLAITTGGVAFVVYFGLVYPFLGLYRAGTERFSRLSCLATGVAWSVPAIFGTAVWAYTDAGGLGAERTQYAQFAVLCVLIGLIVTLGPIWFDYQRRANRGVIQQPVSPGQVLVGLLSLGTLIALLAVSTGGLLGVVQSPGERQAADGGNQVAINTTPSDIGTASLVFEPDGAAAPVSVGDRWVVSLGSYETEGEATGAAGQFPDAVVLHSDDFTSLNPGWWVVAYDGGFESAAEAVTYCHSIGRPTRDACYGRLLSTTQGVDPADPSLVAYPDS